MTAPSFGEGGQNSGGCVTGNATERSVESPLLPMTGRGPRRSFESGFRLETETFCKSSDKERAFFSDDLRSEEHTSELQSRSDLVCRLLLEKKKQRSQYQSHDDFHILL